MGTFVKNSLLHGEKIFKEGKVSWESQVAFFPIGLLFFCLAGASPFFVFLGLWCFGVPFYNRGTTELAVTNKKLIGKKGLIQTDSIDIPLSRVESVIVHKSAFFDHGTIIISGTGGQPVTFRYIAKPAEFRKAVLQMIDTAESGTAIPSALDENNSKSIQANRMALGGLALLAISVAGWVLYVAWATTPPMP